ncbi:hypothetical protein T492DRAFT_296425 [Pavlovales sp. CCMP2436]|nr:hypothetical protein T492DRAFT_296425 [Pavlovales sp. CCMP2436]
MFGMQGLFSIVLGQNTDEDTSSMMMASAGMPPGMMGPPGGGMPGQPVDNQKNYDQERENLSMVDHVCMLDDSEKVLLAGAFLK